MCMTSTFRIQISISTASSSFEVAKDVQDDAEALALLCQVLDLADVPLTYEDGEDSEGEETTSDEI